MTELSTINILPTEEHLYSVIWLHGLGADGHDFESIVPSLNLPATSNIHFIFPNAPVQPVTINNGMKMRSWYDIMVIVPDAHKVNIDDIYRSSEMVNQLIEQEISKGIAADHIVLAGFSQGGVIALHAGLRYPQKLSGIMALSTYLPTIDRLSTEGSSAGKTTPILMAHGILDPIVAIEAGKHIFEQLSAAGYNIEWHDYLMEHSVCPEEVNQISIFLNLVLR